MERPGRRYGCTSILPGLFVVWWGCSGFRFRTFFGHYCGLIQILAKTNDKRYNKNTEFSTLYHTFMRTITLQAIKSFGAKAIPDDAAVTLIVNSQPKSVLVPPEEYEMLSEALAELEEIKIIEERKHEKTVGWNAVFPKKAR
jgi:PHD/YefM family antitoxin component YafN of YafNO toxin-antitoxin module